MADDLLSHFPEYIPYLIAIMVLGSIVDIIQFSWIIRRNYRAWRKRMYNRAKQEVLNELNLNLIRGGKDADKEENQEARSSRYRD